MRHWSEVSLFDCVMQVTVMQFVDHAVIACYLSKMTKMHCNMSELYYA